MELKMQLQKKILINVIYGARNEWHNIKIWLNMIFVLGCW